MTPTYTPSSANVVRYRASALGVRRRDLDRRIERETGARHEPHDVRLAFHPRIRDADRATLEPAKRALTIDVVEPRGVIDEYLRDRDRLGPAVHDVHRPSRRHAAV